MAVEAPTAPVPVVEVAATAEQVDREARFPRASIEALARAGWLGLGVPERFGGPGGGPEDGVGIAGAALAAAVEHAGGARFEHLDSTLADVPGVRARLAEAKIRHAQARAYVQAVARAIAEGGSEAEVGVLALKAAAAEMAVDVTDLCLRVGGGAAYSKHGPLERHYRDARAASVMAPTTDLLRDFLGKALCGQELFR
jgi:alkylation response protein AidB-like acyl-CoA dehydrogenase